MNGNNYTPSSSSLHAQKSFRTVRIFETLYKSSIGAQENREAKQKKSMEI